MAMPVSAVFDITQRQAAIPRRSGVGQNASWVGWKQKEGKGR
jgi:hypothetical protein